jgi:putative lysine transport system substrate-binding protein
MMAKKLCEANGWQLEIVRLDWDSLIPAVQTGQVDAVIAGQSMTRSAWKLSTSQAVSLRFFRVRHAQQQAALLPPKGITDLEGGTCTSQLGTIWYDNLPAQIKDAQVQTAAENAPAMLMAL